MRKAEIACNISPFHTMFPTLYGTYFSFEKHFNPLPDSSKLKEFADDNFRFDENGRKLSKQVENTMGKGEIARHKKFLFFPQCFQKACFPGASKGVIVWEWVKMSSTICFNLDQSKILSSGNGIGHM